MINTRWSFWSRPFNHTGQPLVQQATCVHRRSLYVTAAMTTNNTTVIAPKLFSSYCLQQLSFVAFTIFVLTHFYMFCVLLLVMTLHNDQPECSNRQKYLAGNLLFYKTAVLCLILLWCKSICKVFTTVHVVLVDVVCSLIIMVTIWQIKFNNYFLSYHY